MQLLQARETIHGFEERTAWIEAILISKISELQAEMKCLREEHCKVPVFASESLKVAFVSTEKKNKKK